MNDRGERSFERNSNRVPRLTLDEGAFFMGTAGQNNLTAADERAREVRWVCGEALSEDVADAAPDGYSGGSGVAPSPARLPGPAEEQPGGAPVGSLAASRQGPASGATASWFKAPGKHDLLASQGGPVSRLHLDVDAIADLAERGLRRRRPDPLLSLIHI